MYDKENERVKTETYGKRSFAGKIKNKYSEVIDDISAKKNEIVDRLKIVWSEHGFEIVTYGIGGISVIYSLVSEHKKKQMNKLANNTITMFDDDENSLCARVYKRPFTMADYFSLVTLTEEDWLNGNAEKLLKSRKLI